MHTCLGKSMLSFGLVLWLVSLIFPSDVESKCAGLESAFDILPVGDHFVEYGSSTEMFCKLNTSYESAAGKNSSDLLFYSEDPNPWKSHEIRSVVNETTIKLVLKEPPIGKRYYYCSLDNLPCLTSVTVGHKPRPVEDFRCKSENWETLVCNWTPRKNTVQTKYKLKLILAGRAGKVLPNNAKNPLMCPSNLDEKNNTCIFSLHTEPAYRQPYENFVVELTGENALGSNTEMHTVHHYAIVVPNKPSKLELVDKTINSALIRWELPYPMTNFPPGLKFKIEYKSRWDLPDVWNIIEPRNSSNHPLQIHTGTKYYTFNITGLKYPYTYYDVRVYLKSYAAKPDNGFGSDDWSEPATLTFVTLPQRPSAPPKTTFGSFEIVSRGNDTDVYIYWNRINETMQNGADFRYEISCVVDGYESCGQPTEKTLTFAKYPYSKFREYKFDIVSANEVGNSSESSRVFVPKFETVSQPEGFTKVSYSGGIYELSWNPLKDYDLSNYTLFWCEEDKDLPVPCRGVLDWVHVPKDQTRKNITVRNDKKFYKFAIAANSIRGESSGLVWSSCVIFHDKYLKKVDAVTVSTNSATEADVSWEVRCAQIAAIQGFYVYYCPVTSPNDSGCKPGEKEIEKYVENGNRRNFTLTGLQPYTTYKVQVAILSVDAKSQSALGPRKDSNLFTTHEGAPTEPTNLSVEKVTNSSALLRWKAPKHPNGVLQTYNVYLNKSGEPVSRTRFEAKDTSGKIVEEYEIKGLQGYVKYDVSLKACTKDCSKESERTSFFTLIGTPGIMPDPKVSDVTNTSVVLSWQAPKDAGGKIDYYQVSFRSGDRDEVVMNLTSASGTKTKISIPECKANSRIEFKMRAINVNENKVVLPGPWSDASSVICGSSGWTKTQTTIIWVGGFFCFLVLTGVLSYVIKRGWLKCKKMKNVEIKLPPGLQNQDLEKDGAENYYALEGWPPQTDGESGKVGNSVPPDEESLLNKNSDESLDGTPYNAPNKNGGDSSGCSVGGRESVSSSITSDTHVSSDSGAEADRCLPGSNDNSIGRCYSSGRKHPGSRKSHRRHNETDPQSVGGSNFGDAIRDPVSGYARVGFDDDRTPEKRLPVKGYVTIASVISPNPSPKAEGEKGYTTLPAKDFPRYRVEGAKYVASTRLPDRKTAENHAPSPGSNGSSSTNDSPSLSHFDGSTERDEDEEDASGDSARDESSGNETETETVQGMPFSKNPTPMPPYVSMIENPVRSLRRDDDKPVLDPPGKKTVKGTDKVNNYIPHRIFEKESFHT